jgi:ATP-binding cassette subfamily C protein CydD
MRPSRRLWTELKVVKFPFALSIMFHVINGLLLVGQAYLLSQVVSRVFIDAQTLDDVEHPILGLVVISMGRFALEWSASIAEHEVASAVRFQLRQRLFDHALALGPIQMGQEKSGEILAMVTDGVDALEDYFSKYLPRLFTALLIPLSILIVIMPLDLLSGVILLLTAPLLPLFMVLIGMWAGAISKRQWKTLSYLSAHFLDVLRGLSTLKIFNRSQQQIQTIGRISDQFRLTTMSVLRVAFLSAFALELLTSLSVAVIAVEIGLRLLYSYLDFSDAFFILILAPEFYQPVRNLGTSFHAARTGADAADRMFSFLDTVPAVVPTGTHTVPRAPYLIEFVDVSLTYTTRGNTALQNINLTLHPGEKVALVGDTGAGKSSLANLLLRFLEPTVGEIRVGERSLSEIDISQWRSQIAHVSQHPYLYHASVVENLKLARPNASMNEIEIAAGKAAALDFIQRLPEKWDTSVGERGTRLSGGQAQRLAIARAHLKDAPILIWDEATANLDPLIEEKIRHSMYEFMKDRTVLMIAHRLVTVKQADRIVVLEAGKIVQSGTHSELIAISGTYRDLVDAYAG